MSVAAADPDAPAMVAMQLDAPGRPLREVHRPIPVPGAGQLLIEVSACGICRTDLHVIDGDIHGPMPIVPGHEGVGRVALAGEGASGFAHGQRVGVPWLGHTCGTCFYCKAGMENLCDVPQFTGFTRDGGLASHIVADVRFCFAIPEVFSDVEAAPLMCAGLIGHRSYAMAGKALRLGVYGFGAAAHILAQIAIADGREVYAFTRPGDAEAQDFAKQLGCVWAGGSGEEPPVELDAAIIFAAVGALVPEALRRVRKGGQVICAGIHMSDIPAFPYDALWGERSIRSVANLTRADGVAFLASAARLPVHTTTTGFALRDANRAIELLRAGAIRGAAVLLP